MRSPELTEEDLAARLVDESSLGTRHARRLRSLTDPSVIDRILGDPPRPASSRFGHRQKKADRSSATVIVVAAAAALLLVLGIGLSHGAQRRHDVLSIGISNNGAWLSSGRSIVHIDPTTGRPDVVVDADLVAEAGDQEIVQTEDTLAVVDTGNETVTDIDTSTMTAGSSVDLPDEGGGSGFLVADGLGYLIGERAVQPVDRTTLEPAAEPVEIGRVGGAVITDADTLVVLDTAEGAIVEIEKGHALPPVVITDEGNPADLILSAVGGRPIIVDTDAGTVRRVRPDGTVEEPITIGALRNLDTSDVAVGDPSADGSTAWMVVRPTGELIGVDLDTGTVRSGQLDRQGGPVQPPVVLADHVYVPDWGAHEVIVIDSTGAQLRKIASHEPEGDGPRLEVFAQGEHIWINDPTSQSALVVDTNGVDRRVVPKGLPGVARVPNVVGMSQEDACATLAAHQLTCSWDPSPVNSARNPMLADAQSAGVNVPLPPTTKVSVYHPAGPDATLHRFRAYRDGEPVDQWALAPNPGPGYDDLVDQDGANDWRPDGTVGRCYTTQVEGSIPLEEFIRPNPDDPDYDERFYAAHDSESDVSPYQRGISYYGESVGTLCYVIPWDQQVAGAQPVTEFWNGTAHYYTTSESAPAADYSPVVGHWTTW